MCLQSQNIVVVVQRCWKWKVTWPISVIGAAIETKTQKLPGSLESTTAQAGTFWGVGTSSRNWMVPVAWMQVKGWAAGFLRSYACIPNQTRLADKKKNSFVLVFGMSTSRSELYYKAPHRWSTIAICMWVNIPCAVFFREGQWPYHGQDLLSEAASSLSACPWSTRPLICHLDSIFMPRCFQLCEPLEWGRAWVCVRWKLVDR